MAKAKAKALPKAGPKAGARHPRVRRPAGLLRGGAPAVTEEEKWNRGEVAAFKSVPLEALGRGVQMVLEEAKYYHNDCRAAGEVMSLEVTEGEVWIKMKLSGTDSEALLRLQSGQPSLMVRVHRCRDGCGHESVGEEILHGLRVRKMKAVEDEEGWVRNLEKVAQPDPEDELEALRRVAREGVPGPQGEAVPKKAEAEKKESEKKKKKSKKSKKEKAKEKKEEKKKTKKKKEEEQSGTSESSDLDGRNPRMAALKDPQQMFKGTGLDQDEKIRGRVMRRAKRALRKKGDYGGTSSSGSSSSSSRGDDMLPEETLFLQSSKVKRIAEMYPGALTSQAMSMMRSGLFQEMGTEDQPGTLRPCAVAYFRQNLSRRVTGPAHRELLTLCTALDLLLRGRASSACDLLTQRLKSGESTANGCHWSVSQRMEILGQEGSSIAGTEEVSLAQKSAYAENKTKHLAGQPDGKRRYGKGQGKGKEEKGGQEDRPWQRRKGKGGKDKTTQKKEEGKTS
eukprot:Skav213725  [mRNA]  locus=scaffold2563:63082:64605:+ [translate_table: standard]